MLLWNLLLVQSFATRRENKSIMRVIGAPFIWLKLGSTHITSVLFIYSKPQHVCIKTPTPNFKMFLFTAIVFCSFCFMGESCPLGTLETCDCDGSEISCVLTGCFGRPLPQGAVLELEGEVCQIRRTEIQRNDYASIIFKTDSCENLENCR